MEREFPGDIVLLGHGSHRTDATDRGLADATARLQRLAGPGVRVRMAGFEFTRPNLNEAVTALVEAGSRRIVVVPFFLFDGRHITEEIPEQLEEIAGRFPDVELRYARTFGVNTALIELCTERAAMALAGRALRWPDARRYMLEQRGVGIVLAARGSQPRYDPGIRRDCLALWISMALGDGVQVRGCQAEYASPSVPEAIDALAAAGVQRVVVLPYLFFPGKVLYDNVIPDTERSRGRHPGLDIRVADTLGVDDRLIDLALTRAWDAALRPAPDRIYAASRPARPAAWA
jgi:sirohydrochlorin ferrochelatase